MVEEKLKVRIVTQDRELHRKGCEFQRDDVNSSTKRNLTPQSKSN